MKVTTTSDRWSPRRYNTEEQAFKRVESLRVYGVWPGVIRYIDGRFGLTYDPVSILEAQRELSRS